MKIFANLSALGIIVTYKCNSSCSYCFIKQNTETINEEIIDKSYEFYKSYINNPNITIQLWGGEPLLDLHLCYTVANKFDKNNLFISTNGIKYNKEIEDFIFKYKNRLDLQISCDGKPNLERTDEEQTIKNIKKFSNIIPVTIRSTISPKRINSIMDDTIYLSQYADHINHKIQHNLEEFTLEQLRNFDIELGKLREWYQEQLLNDKQLLLPIFFYYFIMHKAVNFYCPAAIGEIMIDPNGDIYPCLTMANMKINKIENINNLNSIAEKIIKFREVNTLEDKYLDCALTQNTCLINKLNGEKNPQRKSLIVSKIIMKHSLLLYKFLEEKSKYQLDKIKKITC